MRLTIKGGLQSRAANNRVNTVYSQGLKKCKFPRNLIEISCGPQVEDDRPFMTLQKEIGFFKMLHSRASFIQLESVHIQRVNTCITAVYHATAQYAKTRY